MINTKAFDDCGQIASFISRLKPEVQERLLISIKQNLETPESDFNLAEFVKKLFLMTHDFVTAEQRRNLATFMFDMTHFALRSDESFSAALSDFEKLELYDRYVN